VENKLFSPHHQGVASVVAALVAHHHLGLFRQEVNNLSLTFITPLGSHDNDIRQ
jgi:hypothetical protein